ncbi:MAG: hypothetical protein ULS35scaffold63_50 [Phage 33_17]|nr:MAG: hypothetical protein ULS35scaffold63_50 [Phage 33_17]
MNKLPSEIRTIIEKVHNSTCGNIDKLISHLLSDGGSIINYGPPTLQEIDLAFKYLINELEKNENSDHINNMDRN